VSTLQPLTPNERKVLDSLAEHGDWVTMGSLRRRNLERFGPWGVQLLSRTAMSLQRRDLVLRRRMYNTIEYKALQPAARRALG
jgi:hypothetical protein